MASEQIKTLRLESMDKLNIDVKKLDRLRVKELTDIQRARLLEVRPEALSSTLIELRPSKPSSAKGFLTFFSSMMVMSSNPLPQQRHRHLQLVVSGRGLSGHQVEFKQIKKNKTHLVEFHITLNQPKTYKFRVFSYPLATFQDISIDKSQVITALVPSFEGITSYGAALQQRNAAGDDAGWLFHKVRITAIA